MARRTPATVALEKAGICFTVHTYEYDPTAPRVGLQAAEALGVSPREVLKTLMVLVDGKPGCILVPSDCEASMKKVAAAFGGKSATMMPPPEAERLTGYKVGGISPFGQRRAVQTVIDESAFDHAEVFINGGQRGLQVKVAPAFALCAVSAVMAPLIA